MNCKTFSDCMDEAINRINLYIALTKRSAKQLRIKVEVDFMMLIHFLNFDIRFFVESLGELKDDEMSQM